MASGSAHRNACFPCVSSLFPHRWQGIGLSINWAPSRIRVAKTNALSNDRKRDFFSPYGGADVLASVVEGDVDESSPPERDCG